MKKKIIITTLVGIITMVALTAVPSVLADKTYTFSSFVAIGRPGTGVMSCRDTTSVSLASGTSVTKTKFTGKSGSKKPSNEEAL